VLPLNVRALRVYHYLEVSGTVLLLMLFELVLDIFSLLFRRTGRCEGELWSYMTLNFGRIA
jgi:hypothetical protein